MAVLEALVEKISYGAMEWIRTGAMIIGICLPIVWYMCVAGLASAPSNDAVKGKNVLLLIAHPDDETMFFSPTLQLTEQFAAGTYVLCLSTGDAEGQGAVRSRELAGACRLHGIPAARAFVLNHPDLQDSMTSTWSPSVIGTAVYERVRQGSFPWPDVVITFDANGVSRHPNHAACRAGAVEFATRNRGKHHVDVYELITTGTLRKYCGVLDVLTSMALYASSFWIKSARSSRWSKRARKTILLSRMFVVARPSTYLRGVAAMTSAHTSQMRWFRYGWLFASRYMYMNDLRKV